MSLTTAGRIVAAGLLALGATGLAVGQEDRPAPEPPQPALEELAPLPRLETALADIRAQVRNASMKVKYVTGGRPQVGNMVQAHERVVRNTAHDCCSRNIGVISDRLQIVTGAMGELHASHQRERNERALTLVSHMGEHVGGLRSNFTGFTKASESPAALKSLDGMGDELLHLERDLAEYRKCCAEDGAGLPGS